MLNQTLYYWPAAPLDSDKNIIPLLVLNIISMVIAVPGNALVCYAIARTRKLREEPSYLLIMSVGFADFFIGAIAQVLVIIKLLQNQTLQQNLLFDKISYCIVWGLCCISGFGVLCLTIDRFLFFEYSISYASLVTRRRMLGLIFTHWFLGILYGALPVVDECDSILKIVNFVTLIFINAFMGFVYVRVQRSISKQRRQISERYAKNKESLERKGSFKKLSKTKQMTITMVLIVFTFCGCWYPYTTVGLVLSLSKVSATSTGVSIFYWGLTLGFMNSSFNIFIYGMKNRELKTHVVRLVCQKYRKVGHDGKSKDSM